MAEGRDADLVNSVVDSLVATVSSSVG